MVVSANGLGKRTSVEDYRLTNRGGKGVKTINITKKTGDLIGLLGVFDTDDVFITCVSGVTIRMGVEGIRSAGRATQGVKLINIDEGDTIAAIARIMDQDDDEDEREESAENETTTEGTSSAEASEVKEDIKDDSESTDNNALTEEEEEDE